MGPGDLIPGLGMITWSSDQVAVVAARWLLVLVASDVGAGGRGRVAAKRQEVGLGLTMIMPSTGSSRPTLIFGQRKHFVERPCARMQWKHGPMIPTNTDKNVL
jgi:hypothetical protein